MILRPDVWSDGEERLIKEIDSWGMKWTRLYIRPGARRVVVSQPVTELVTKLHVTYKGFVALLALTSNMIPPHGIPSGLGETTRAVWPFCPAAATARTSRGGSAINTRIYEALFQALKGS